MGVVSKNALCAISQEYVGVAPPCRVMGSFCCRYQAQLGLGVPGALS